MIINFESNFESYLKSSNSGFSMHLDYFLVYDSNNNVSEKQNTFYFISNEVNNNDSFFGTYLIRTTKFQCKLNDIAKIEVFAKKVNIEDDKWIDKTSDIKVCTIVDDFNLFVDGIYKIYDTKLVLNLGDFDVLPKVNFDDIKPFISQFETSGCNDLQTNNDIIINDDYSVTIFDLRNKSNTNTTPLGKLNVYSEKPQMKFGTNNGGRNNDTSELLPFFYNEKVLRLNNAYHENFNTGVTIGSKDFESIGNRQYMLSSLELYAFNKEFYNTNNPSLIEPYYYNYIGNENCYIGLPYKDKTSTYSNVSNQVLTLNLINDCNLINSGSGNSSYNKSNFYLSKGIAGGYTFQNMCVYGCTNLSFSFSIDKCSYIGVNNSNFRNAYNNVDYRTANRISVIGGELHNINSSDNNIKGIYPSYSIGTIGLKGIVSENDGHNGYPISLGSYNTSYGDFHVGHGKTKLESAYKTALFNQDIIDNLINYDYWTNDVLPRRDTNLCTNFIRSNAFSTTSYKGFVSTFVSNMYDSTNSKSEQIPYISSQNNNDSDIVPSHFISYGGIAIGGTLNYSYWWIGNAIEYFKNKKYSKLISDLYNDGTSKANQFKSDAENYADAEIKYNYVQQEYYVTINKNTNLTDLLKDEKWFMNPGLYGCVIHVTNISDNTLTLEWLADGTELIVEELVWAIYSTTIGSEKSLEFFYNIREIVGFRNGYRYVDMVDKGYKNLSTQFRLLTAKNETTYTKINTSQIPDFYKV